MMKEPVPEYSN